MLGTHVWPGWGEIPGSWQSVPLHKNGNDELGNFSTTPQTITGQTNTKTPRTCTPGRLYLYCVQSRGPPRSRSPKKLHGIRVTLRPVHLVCNSKNRPKFIRFICSHMSIYFGSFLSLSRDPNRRPGIEFRRREYRV